MTDGIKNKERESDVKVMDIAELIVLKTCNDEKNNYSTALNFSTNSFSRCTYYW
jgi:hypothetical protein